MTGLHWGHLAEMPGTTGPVWDPDQIPSLELTRPVPVPVREVGVHWVNTAETTEEKEVVVVARAGSLEEVQEEVQEFDTPHGEERRRRRNKI